MSTMTKREILLAIVENPGWQPHDSSAVARLVQELFDDGWVIARGQNAARGWEAAPKAITNYPHYHEWPDLRDPYRVEPPKPAAREGPRTVPTERVECLLAGMLRTLPVVEVYRLVAAVPAQVSAPSSPEWEIAHKLAESMASR